MGQCTEAMIARIEAHPSYSSGVSNDRNGIGLLQIIRSICFNFEDQQQVAQSVHEALQRFYALKQAKHETVAQYYERYQNQVEVMDQCGAAYGNHSGVMRDAYKTLQIDPNTASPVDKARVETYAKESSLAMGLILGADRARFGSMIQEFENAYTTGDKTKWPKTLSGAYRVLSNS